MSQNIRNIASSPHVDHGKTTLVAAMAPANPHLRATKPVERVMDANDPSASAASPYRQEYRALFHDTKINIVGTRPATAIRWRSRACAAHVDA